MTEENPVRIDKFLWAVRLFKTRGLAANACRMGRVMLNNNNVKPSKYAEVNEILVIRKPPVTYTYRIKGITGNRISPKLVFNFLEDLTPEEEKVRLDISRSVNQVYRKKGSGRPTKKERRIIDWWNDIFFL